MASQSQFELACELSKERQRRDDAEQAVVETMNAWMEAEERVEQQHKEREETRVRADELVRTVQEHAAESRRLRARVASLEALCATLRSAAPQSHTQDGAAHHALEAPAPPPLTPSPERSRFLEAPAPAPPVAVAARSAQTDLPAAKARSRARSVQTEISSRDLTGAPPPPPPPPADSRKGSASSTRAPSSGRSRRRPLPGPPPPPAGPPPVRPRLPEPRMPPAPCEPPRAANVRMHRRVDGDGTRVVAVSVELVLRSSPDLVDRLLALLADAGARVGLAHAISSAAANVADEPVTAGAGAASALVPYNARAVPRPSLGALCVMMLAAAYALLLSLAKRPRSRASTQASASRIEPNVVEVPLVEDVRIEWPMHVARILTEIDERATTARSDTDGPVLEPPRRSRAHSGDCDSRLSRPSQDSEDEGIIPDFGEHMPGKRGPRQ